MRALSSNDVTFYERNGYLLLERFIDDDWLARLRAATERFVAESRTMVQSSARVLLEPSHRPDCPRLRRIPNPVCHDADFEAFGIRGPLLDIAEDLLGPDIRFHHSKLNFKWLDGGEAVEWHQDIQFWPHTNYSPLTIGVYLQDVTDEMGPMGVVPGSHQGEIFHLVNEQGAWNGAINSTDLRRVALDRVVWLTGPAGSVTVHNCRTVHGSMPNHSPSMRPLLLHTYSAADALPVTDLMHGVPFSNEIVRGRTPPSIRFDATPCPMPPDFRRTGYSSIFATQRSTSNAALNGGD